MDTRVPLRYAVKHLCRNRNRILVVLNLVDRILEKFKNFGSKNVMNEMLRCA